jgi:hypothetical protein
VAILLRDVLWVPGDAVSRFLIPHARRIVDATVEEMPEINWRTAVLTRRIGACAPGVPRRAPSRSSLGCPLLLHLWIYERLPVVRPSVDGSPYQALEEGHDPANRATMGLMWFHHQVRTSS